MGNGIASILLVALGGALGGIGRYAVSNLIAHLLGKAFPWGTLLVNASGAFIAGGLLGYYGVPTVQPVWLFAVAGLLGGYTTVSSFSLQTIELWQSGLALRATLNIAATIVLGMVMAMFGWLLAKELLL
ncbi:MAG: fluoride efflux transporter CrcB [Halomonas venusta]|uniref:fluoride efflux transporter CrcB n=1 Tax=Vreelandella venusta TaxID=44935 RepID=UPI002285A7CB|nr:fluoride efflux transporter CrcB [Halomonas venusta]MDX1354916.1 fluoride efflux transporter CrcB [Halomonas venusta]MDX1712114.1 fluoride efflux transporter CrcB [Halomonas venusta]WAM47819.1 fluoride efflux transporter CrcB [Halomonas venusta]